MNIDLKTKIDDYNKDVDFLREKLAQAESVNNGNDVSIFNARLKDVAYARYAIKSLYIETISKSFDIALEDLISQVGSHIDISKISDEYEVFVVAKKKT